MELSEKAAYLKGLVEGLGIDESTKEGKVIRAMSELMLEMAASLRDIDEDVSQVYDDVDALNEELENLEADLLDDDEDYDDEDEDDEDEEAQYELTCPKCGAVTVVDEDTLLSQEISCSNCGAPFDIEFGEDEDDDGDDE